MNAFTCIINIGDSHKHKLHNTHAPSMSIPFAYNSSNENKKMRLVAFRFFSFFRYCHRLSSLQFCMCNANKMSLKLSIAPCIILIRHTPFQSPNFKSNRIFFQRSHLVRVHFIFYSLHKYAVYQSSVMRIL